MISPDGQQQEQQQQQPVRLLKPADIHQKKIEKPSRHSNFAHFSDFFLLFYKEKKKQIFGLSSLLRQNVASPLAHHHPTTHHQHHPKGNQSYHTKRRVHCGSAIQSLAASRSRSNCTLPVRWCSILQSFNPIRHSKPCPTSEPPNPVSPPKLKPR